MMRTTQILRQSLLDSNLGAKDGIEKYVKWYEAVEELIGVLLEDVGITVDPSRDLVTGQHRYHEALLETLRTYSNPYHNTLGQGQVHDTFEVPRTSEILTAGNCLPQWIKIKASTKEVEDALCESIKIMNHTSMRLP